METWENKFLLATYLNRQKRGGEKSNFFRSGVSLKTPFCRAETKNINVQEIFFPDGSFCERKTVPATCEISNFCNTPLIPPKKEGRGNNPY